MEKGKIITFEGGEGCGKDTQLEYMVSYLQGKGLEVLSLREPGGSPWGEACRKLSKFYDGPDKNEIHPIADALVIASARAQLYHGVIGPHIDSGGWVVKARGPRSTEVYQGIVDGGDRSMIEQLETIATNGLYVDDLTYILDVPVEVGLARQQGDEECRFGAREAEFHERVRQGYLEVADNSPPNVLAVEYTAAGPEEVHRQLTKVLEERFFS